MPAPCDVPASLDNLARTLMPRQATAPSAHAADLSLTERPNPRTAAIDLATPLDIVDLMAAEDAGVPGAVAAERAQVARAIELAEAAFRAGGRLFYVGAGTSGRLGVLDASECPPTFGTDPEMVQGIIAGGRGALTRAKEGAEDRAANGGKDLATRGLTARDFVIGIAASATTPYVLGALTYARSFGARTALVAMSPPPAELAAVIDLAIVPLVGPEVVTGSTRLKAGTATKLVLNMITTGAMIRLGKTYGNRMVDLRATNAKLRSRAERIVAELCELPRPRARALLASAGGSAKTAIVMGRLGIGREDAETRLASAGGVMRRVIGDPLAPPPPAPAP
jgi:N-acetylmuramic acid 6-phosphate etherase